MRPDDCVVAVDVGTSAVRAVAVDQTGRVLAESRTNRGPAVGDRFDAEELWSLTCRCLVEVSECLAGVPVNAVAIVGHVGTVFVDAAGQVVDDGRGWGDTSGLDVLRTQLQSARLEDKLLRDSGRPVLTGGGLAALLDLRRNAPSDYARVAAVLQPKDFLVLRLTDRCVTDHTSAAYTLASDVRRRAWSTGMLEALGIDIALLPDQVPATTVIGSVSTAAATATGIAAGTPVVAGGPDGSVGAALVTGPARTCIADVAGTTDVLVRLVDTPPDAPHTSGAVLNPAVLEDIWSIGGATGSTGGTVGWWASVMGLGDAGEALEKLWPEMDSIGPGAGGVRVDPSLTGSRFPQWDATARCSVRGLTPRHGPAEIMRASLEAAAYVVRDGVSRLVSESEDVEVVLAGGVARSARLAQLRADVLGRRIRVWSTPDVSLMGAVLLASVGAEFGDLTQLSATMLGTSCRFEPDMQARVRYDELFEEWRADLCEGTG